LTEFIINYDHRWLWVILYVVCLENSLNEHSEKADQKRIKYITDVVKVVL
jgi:hypothetical protein